MRVGDEVLTAELSDGTKITLSNSTTPGLAQAQKEAIAFSLRRIGQEEAFTLKEGWK